MKLKQYLAKGTKVVLSGTFKFTVKDSKTFLNVTVSELDLVSTPKVSDKSKSDHDDLPY